MSAEDRLRWNERYRSDDLHASLAGGEPRTEPAPFVVSLEHRLPRKGRALDVAGGPGRHGLWLAARGLEVTIADISEEGLVIARRRANETGLTIQTLAIDLEHEPFPAGPWDLVVCVHYLERAIFPRIAQALAPAGMFVFVHPTLTNLERHPRPPRRFLLEPGEVRSLVGTLEVLVLDESWSDEGFHEARLLATTSAASPSKRRESRCPGFGEAIEIPVGCDAIDSCTLCCLVLDSDESRY